jgi:hypothetical protein
MNLHCHENHKTDLFRPHFYCVHVTPCMTAVTATRGSVVTALGLDNARFLHQQNGAPNKIKQRSVK